MLFLFLFVISHWSVVQIDAEMVKSLDSNLFQGGEITEVYKEIMKTVPTDHLLLDNVFLAVFGQ